MIVLTCIFIHVKGLGVISVCLHSVIVLKLKRRENANVYTRQQDKDTV